MSQADMADIFEVSASTMATYDREGLAAFARVSEKPVAYDVGKAWRWRWDNKREVSTTQKDAKLRKLTAEAGTKELELAERQGVVMRVEAHRSTIRGILVRLRAKIIAAKGSLAPRLAGLDSPRDVALVIGPALDELVEDLRRAGELVGEPDA